jgi:antitoxin (DNA-binding transcriptional repressor) of toxin-antitoxin stability system
MKTLELSEATGTLAEYAREVEGEPLVLTIDGSPVAALVSIEHADLETISLSANPRFIALIERSRARHQTEGGISSEEMRRRLQQP